MFLACRKIDHPGGLARSSDRTIKSVVPLGDIRHRMLSWNANTEMREPRDLPPINPHLSDQDEKVKLYLGESKSLYRLGRANQLRRLPREAYNVVRKERDHHGPYLPVILEACRENEFAYEYRHGTTSYGAFTFTMANLLRQHYTQGGKGVTFQELVDASRDHLLRLKYEQRPQVLGPQKILSQHVPWLTDKPAQPKTSRRRKKKQ